MRLKPDLKPRPGGATERLFRQRQWARRWGTWRGAVVLALVVVLTVLTAWLVFFSSVLAVEASSKHPGGVEVVGESQISEAVVVRRARVPVGEPLARVDLDAIRERVQGIPAVQSADVSRGWPDHVRIEIVERVAVAVIDEGDQLRALDDEGVVFRSFDERPKDLPLIRIAPDTPADAMTEAAAVVGTLPAEVAKKVAYVDVKTRDEITLTLKRGKTVLWGGSSESEDKALVLGALLKSHPGATAYDVSVPGQPTVR